MVDKPYEWVDGAELHLHTARKLKILGEYFGEYLRVRCVTPQQSVFRLAVVDGFAGGGRYKNGEAGSPIVLIETLQKVVTELRLSRKINGMAPLTIICRLILNDADPEVARFLRDNIAPLLAAIKEEAPDLNINCSVHSQEFEHIYPAIKKELQATGFKSVLFNLDQCGYKWVSRKTIDDILGTFRASEIFLTFMISSLLTYLSKDSPEGLLKKVQHLGVRKLDLDEFEPLMSNHAWLGAAERIVFSSFSGAASFVSPFSINNPDGWRYWLIHFSHATRARQVYNDALHRNASHQAHYGKSGLDMLTYDPERDGALCLFDDDGRKAAVDQLAVDVPRAVSGFGDAINVDDFYHDIYNLTAAHSEDIRTALFNADDLEVVTKNGGVRQKANTISGQDIIRIKSQRSFHFLWK